MELASAEFAGHADAALAAEPASAKVGKLLDVELKVALASAELTVELAGPELLELTSAASPATTT